MVAGDIHGNLDTLYRKWQEVTQKSGITVDALLVVGDFGFWPREVGGREFRLFIRHETPVAERKNPKKPLPIQGYIGDYHKYLSGEKQIPVDTYFVRGNHEDQEELQEIEKEKNGLDQPRSCLILPRLWYLPDGSITEIQGVKIAGLGGNYGPSSWEKDYWKKYRRLEHTTKDRWQMLLDKNFDVLLSHDGPDGFDYPGNPHLRELIEKCQPKWAFCGHYHHLIKGNINQTEIRFLQRISPTAYDGDGNYTILEI